jgi:hypothetical protein
MKNFLRKSGAQTLDFFLKVENILRNNKSLIQSEIRIQKVKKIAVFAIYRLERLESISEYIEEIESCGFTVIPIINSERISGLQNQLAERYLLRENFGYDLGIYRDGLRLFEMEESGCTQVLLLNDSMYYENGTLTKLISIAANKPSNCIYSILESNQPKRHIQTYFMFANLDKNCINELRTILDLVKNWKFKRSAVTIGEKNIFTNLDKFSLSSEGLWSTTSLKRISNKECVECIELNDKSDNRINPTDHLIHKLEVFDLVLGKVQKR